VVGVLIAALFAASGTMAWIGMGERGSLTVAAKLRGYKLIAKIIRSVPG